MAGIAAAAEAPEVAAAGAGSVGETAAARRTAPAAGWPRGSTSQGPTRTSGGSARTSGGTRTTRGRTSPKLPQITGKAGGGILFAEFLAGGLLIFMGIFTKGPSQGYLTTMSQIILRLTALTAVFFTLFLVASSPKAGKAAMWFGLLVDLGILFTAVNQQQFATLTDIIKGQPTGVGETELTSATDLPEPVHEQLPQ